MTNEPKRAGRAQEIAMTGPGYRLAEFLNENWTRFTSLTNQQVAMDWGYRTGNIISQMKTGRMRVPLERLPDIANTLKLDYSVLFPLWAEQYWGDRKDGEAVLERIKSHMIMETEIPFAQAIRKAAKVAKVSLLHPDIIEAVKIVIEDKGIRDDILSASRHDPESDTKSANNS